MCRVDADQLPASTSCRNSRVKLKPGLHGWKKTGSRLTGQVPPVMMRSKDKASGIPKDMPPEPPEPPEAWESMDVSPIDLVFSSPRTEARAEST